ncbi:MAG: alpha-L-rhamnosidase N-terminal domain-containing protein, partial [Peptococcaceae bacterium]|nr:alpha-L-rhamnosidase N-terminal domain-containing protein [Peptococcaceae bacterium]
MRQNEMFGEAKWVRGGNFPILRSHFTVKGVKKAMLRVLGLGFFHCYINGKEVTEDAFLPLSTDYEARDSYPTFETVTGHRIYVPEYDITSLLKEGENTIAILYGGGWYTFEDAKFGDAKAIYRIIADTADGVQEYISSEADKIGKSFISDYYLPQYENHDYRCFDDAALGAEFDDSGWAQ